MKSNNELIFDLNWRGEQRVQNYAIEQLSSLEGEEINLLIQPFDNKACWENAALVIQRIGYPKVKMVIPKLLDWIADLNWPGAEIIFRFLVSIGKDELMVDLKNALHKAASENDFIWIAVMKRLIIQIGCEDVLNNEPEFRKILLLAEKS